MYADWLPADCDPDDFSRPRPTQAISLVGVDANELLRGFEEFAEGAVRLPQPRVELAELLGRCPDQTVDGLARVTARAIGLDETVTGDDLRLAVRPWQTVLEAIGDDGVQLSAAGWLPPATVQRIWQESGLAWEYGKGNREQHTPEVATLRQDCVRAGMLRKHKGRLLLTKRGQQCRNSADELAAAIADSLVHDKDDFTQDARVVSLLFIAADWQLGPDSRWAADAAARGEELRPREIREAFWDDVAHLLNDMGWRVDGKLPVHRDHLRYEARAAIRTLSTGGSPRHALPRTPAIRKIAKAAPFG